VKSTWLDRRLQLNLAAFTTRYDGIQLNFQQGVSPTVQNAGTARIKGFEAEATIAPAGGPRSTRRSVIPMPTPAFCRRRSSRRTRSRRGRW
jgi:outer membrane receptor protein involved in Fe transport